jgi:hypothetical protein
MREFLAHCHTHLDDADQIISGQIFLYHALLLKAYQLGGERKWNGTGSTVCFETHKNRTTLHLLLRQTKALTSDTHNLHGKQTLELHRNLTGLPIHVLHRSKASHICCCLSLCSRTAGAPNASVSGHHTETHSAFQYPSE